MHSAAPTNLDIDCHVSNTNWNESILLAPSKLTVLGPCKPTVSDTLPASYEYTQIPLLQLMFVIGISFAKQVADPERKLVPLSPTINIPPFPSVVLDPIPSDP